MRDLDAVLWDLDGTLIDSEPAWHVAERRIAEEFGIDDWGPADEAALTGVALLDGARYIIGRGVRMAPDAIVERLSGEVIASLRERMPFRDGADELLVALRREGIRTALVTMSTRPLVEIVLDALRDQLGEVPFDVTVAGDEVPRGKPWPDPYLQGLTMLGVDAARCVAIEDSVPGTTSALAAGLTTIGVPHGVDLSEISGLVHWRTLADRTPADVRALLGAEA